MADNLLWLKLENLRPSLPRHIDIQRRDFQGEPWYVLQDKSNGRFHRLTPPAWRLLGSMDGQRNLPQILAAAGDPSFYEDEQDIPTQDELIHLLQYLHVADLLVCDMPPNTRELFNRREKKRRQPWLRLLVNPVTWTIPLGNPDRLLQRMMPLARVLASPGMLAIWLLVVGGALLQALIHWDTLTHGQWQRVMSPANLFVLWLTYPLLKVVHELGHGLFTKVWGGQVHQCGLVFVLFTPLPFVDASSATGFASKRRRMMVTAAGIAVELFLAAIALLVWLMLQPGLLRDFLYNIILIGSVSTLFFNGNPLTRFDGYHLLSDWLDMPNLATRANQQINYLVRRYLFGLSGLYPPAANRREAVLFALYALAAFGYRIVILATIVLLAARYLPQLALVLGAWLLFFQVLWPMVKAVHYLLHNPQLGSQRTRALSVSGAVVTIFLGCVMWLPLPYSTSVEGVVWLDEEAYLKAGADGLVSELRVREGEQVTAGQIIAVTINPTLDARLRQKQAEVREYEARYQEAWADDRAQAQLMKEQRDDLAVQVADLRERQSALIIRSPGDGIFRGVADHELIGSYLHRGDPIGVVLKPEPLKIRTALTQEETGLVRAGVTALEVRLVTRPDQVLVAEATREVPAATLQLPSAVLGAQGGGRLAVDNSAQDPTRVADKVFLMDLVVATQRNPGRLGERVYVKFSHPPQSIGKRLYRRLQQVFIRRFS